MTTEEKARAYDEALERAKAMIDDLRKGEDILAVSEIEAMFPELKESEDEKIREFLIDLLSHGTWKKDWPFSPAECVAWLEKQKDINCLACDEHLKGYLAGRKVTEEKQKEQKPAEEDGPFNEDEFLENELSAFLQNYDKEYDDDVAVSDVARHFYEIGKKQKEQKPVEIHIDNPNIEKFDPDMKITTSDSSADDDELLYVCNKSYKIDYRDGKRDAEQKPVKYLDKDKVYAIMNKLTELSTSDLIPIESEEYVKIHEITSDVCSLLNYPIEQKPAEWSERDEEMLEYVIDDVNDAKQLFATKDAIELCDKEIAWLKSLRPQSQGIYQQVVKSLRDMCDRYEQNGMFTDERARDFLGNVRVKCKDAIECAPILDEPNWKPSEEHLSALLAVFNDPNNIGSQTCQLALTDLYEQLKRLK